MSKEFVWRLDEAKSPAQFNLGRAAANAEACVQRNRDLVTRRSDRPTESGRHARRVKKATSPEAVLRSFNTWAFKREQPTEPQLLARIVAEAVGCDEPLSFVLYWGKGPRPHVGAPDIECLDYLGALSRRVSEVYAPGATVELIFTDTHAQLNGHAPPDTGRYFAEIEAQAATRGFSTRRLSKLTRIVEAAGACAIDQEPVPEDLLHRLSVSAGKWYRGEGNARDGALKYFRMNMIEKRAVEFAFPRSIFITFNGSDLRRLFPDRLPVFYMYSLRRGVSVKPWFLPATTPENFEPAHLP